jgi:hypothetical protein
MMIVTNRLPDKLLKAGFTRNWSSKTGKVDMIFLKMLSESGA